VREAVRAPMTRVRADRVLVVDDDPTVAEVVVSYLRRRGMDADHVSDGPSALARIRATAPDLVVLDLMLPGLDGLEVCRRLRATSPGAPVPRAPAIIMLTARGDESDRILGLELGADDYVTKPFSPRELVLRVESVLRRSSSGHRVPAAAGPADRADPADPADVAPGSDPDNTAGSPGSRDSRASAAAAGSAARRSVRDGDLVIDLEGHRVWLDGNELTLTVREFDLLSFIVQRPGRAFGRDELMNQVWGWEFGDSSTVTVHVRRLREKIEVDPARPVRLVTVWGVGYRWDGSVPA
jgi:DNA-binding response OmpR family regulator